MLPLSLGETPKHGQPGRQIVQSQRATKLQPTMGLKGRKGTHRRVLHWWMVSSSCVFAGDAPREAYSKGVGIEQTRSRSNPVTL